jgi:hypothetical protein
MTKLLAEECRKRAVECAEMALQQSDPETQAGVLGSCSNVTAYSSTKRKDEGRLDRSHL